MIGSRPDLPHLARRRRSGEAHLRGSKQSQGKAVGPEHRSYLTMSARCGEKYTMENTTLTRYKNSHPHCHSVLNISSKNLLRWKDSSCSHSQHSS